jgi:hypothetical protein
VATLFVAMVVPVVLELSMVAFKNLLERLSYFWNHILCDDASTFFRECTATGGTSYHAPADGSKQRDTRSGNCVISRTHNFGAAICPV